MKSKLLALGFAVSALPVIAQEHYAGAFNKSAFSGFHKLKASGRTDMQMGQKVQQHFPGMSFTVDKLSGMITDLFGAAQPVSGNTLEAKAQNCFIQHLSQFGINAAEWQQTRNIDAGHASFISYEQYLNGHKVVFSKIHFRFTPGGALERIKLKTFGAAPNLSPALTAEQAKISAAQDITSGTITATTVDENWVWFPVPSASGYTLRPAYAFNIQGATEQLPFDLTGYVDAVTGEVLYRSNRVKETLNMTVKGTVYKQNPLQPATDEVLPNLAIEISGTPGVFYTDTAGVLDNAALTAPLSATLKLQGKWSKVNFGVPAVTPSFTYSVATNGSTFTFPAVSPSAPQAVNAYYHVNRVHDFMKGFFPTFNVMDYALPTNVDINTNANANCNAYYNGNSINFYAQYGVCNSFANCGDIIYHEYGHGISDKFYDWMGGNGMINGALNEGNSDVWGMGITHDPVVGKGAFTNNGVIRRYDMAPKVYPQDIEGEVHADGEIIAGAWWDVAVNTNDVAFMSDLFAKTYFDLPDGPDGTEGEVYHDVLISALQNDDNDANLANGTPHFTEIVTAFARHGIYLLGDAAIKHVEADHQPVNTPVTVNVDVTTSTPAFLGDVKLFYRVRGGAWDSLVMTHQGGTNYSGQIPGQAEGAIVDYYFGVYDNMGTPFANSYAPFGFRPGAVSVETNIPYQFGVGLGKIKGFDFETPVTDWTIGNAPGDNATSGIWVQAKPIGSYVNSVSGQLPVQPNYDKTLGNGQNGMCLVTGNASSTGSPVGTADVDNGKTTVITPTFDLTDFEQPVIEYYRWYTNDMGSNPGQDIWNVQIKDASAVIWIQNVDRTRVSDNSWRRRIFAVKEYLPNSKQVMMRFVAEDLNPGSAVEAAVDDIFIYDKASSPLSVGGSVELQRAAIYPNPANNEVRVTFTANTSGTIGLFDLSGKQIMQQEIRNAKEVMLQTAQVAPGTYFLMINTGNSIQTHKLSILH